MHVRSSIGLCRSIDWLVRVAWLLVGGGGGAEDTYLPAIFRCWELNQSTIAQSTLIYMGALAVAAVLVGALWWGKCTDDGDHQREEEAEERL